MRKILMLFVAVVVAAMVAGCTSCGGDKMKDSKGFDSIPAVTKADTVRVLKTTDEFMSAMKSGDVERALGMLEELVDGHPFPLMDSVKTRYKRQFERFPVLDYEVVESDIRHTEYATATYRYRFMDAPEGDKNFPCWTTLTLEERIVGGHDFLILSNYHKVVGPYATMKTFAKPTE